MTQYIFSTDGVDGDVQLAAKTLAVYNGDEVIVGGDEARQGLVNGEIDVDDIYLLSDRESLNSWHSTRNRISAEDGSVFIRDADDSYPREITLPTPTPSPASLRRYDIPDYLLKGLIGAQVVNCCTSKVTFTAWDVTSALRENLKHVNINHDDVREYVHEVMVTLRDIYGYRSEDRVQDDGQTARTYFPVTASINIMDALRMFEDDDDDLDSRESTSEFLDRLFGKL